MLELFFPIISFLFGLSVGSFLNALIWRVQVGKSFFWKRSQCPRCGHELICLDLIPVFSFLFLFGRCRYCKRKISWQYPLVELSTAFLFTLFYLKSAYFLKMGLLPLNLHFWLVIVLEWFLLAVLVVIFTYDAKHGLIPDKFSIPAIFVAFFGNFLLGENIWNIGFAATIGGGFFLVQYLISRGRWIGGGDIRLGILMGAILGYPNVISALFLAYFIGAIYSIALVALRRKTLKSNIPLGPFLVTGTIIAMFLGDR
ncbi:MAG: prepilin peptidase, partial [Patescibacteria group bacterium]|nr:prepilin peptidase [Patescibacteria group bacterium]